MKSAVSIRIRGLLVVLLVFGPAAGRSEAIFSNLGAGDTYDCCQGWTVYGSSAPIATDRASPFVPDNDYTLDSIELALTWLGSTNSAEVWLLSDDAGLPGDILESFLLTDFPPFLSTDTALASATSTLHPLLVAGTQHWVATSASGSSDLSFNWNITGDTGLASRDNSGPWGAPARSSRPSHFASTARPSLLFPNPPRSRCSYLALEASA